MERCSIYFRKDAIYIAPVSFTDHGVPVARPLAKLDRLLPIEIGDAIVEALDATKREIPHPKGDAEWLQLEKELYQFIEVSSWAELVETSSYINVEREGSTIKIHSHISKSGYGFEEFGQVITCSSTDTEEIGLGVSKALKLQNTYD